LGKRLINLPEFQGPFIYQILEVIAVSTYLRLGDSQRFGAFLYAFFQFEGQLNQLRIASAQFIVNFLQL
jgi:hypothetical protein